MRAVKKTELSVFDEDTGPDEAGSPVKRSQADIVKLLRVSPYVGFCLHAPPSPIVHFARRNSATDSLPCFELFPEEDEDSEVSELELLEASELLPGFLAEDLWANILNYVTDIASIPAFSRLDRNFHGIMRHAATWQGRAVVVPIGALPSLAPHLDHWLSAWTSVSKLVIPRSKQLQQEVSCRAPNMKVEVAWRFDCHSKGEGVEVLRDGATVRRTDVEEVVVLGDAPLVVGEDRPAYMEVRLDELDSVPSGDGLNDFGIGVTACAPEDIEELGCVADEVPCSWIVDFAHTSVCLSVNNNLETKGTGAGAEKLVSGDRVGVLVAPAGDALQVFINGVLCETLRVPAAQHVPRGIPLFPVLDLYGRAVQISCTRAERPQQ